VDWVDWVDWLRRVHSVRFAPRCPPQVDPDEPHSWAIASGILIHGPEQSNFFWAGTLDVEEPQREAKSVLSELHGLTRKDYTDEMVRHHKSLAEQTGRILCGDASEFPF